VVSIKTIEIKMEGHDLLMHKIGEATQRNMENKGRKTTDIPTPEAEAEDGAYRNKEGYLVLPSRCVKAMLVRASGWYKMGKKSMRQYLAGCTIVQPNEIILETKGKKIKTYEIDARPVVIGRGNKVIRHRPLIRNWSATFQLIYNEDVFRTKEQLDIIKQIFEEGGMRCGLLDNRPERGGENGMFSITSWKVKK
jgi:hypothetical protein